MLIVMVGEEDSLRVHLVLFVKESARYGKSHNGKVMKTYIIKGTTKR